MNERTTIVAEGSSPSERLADYNRSLTGLVTEARARLEELEDIVSAISGGQVDAVVVDRRGQPEIWTLEATDRLHLKLCEQAASLGTWHWDASSGQVTCSQAMLRMLGLPGDAVPTIERALSLLHPNDRDWVAGGVRAAVEKRDNYYDEFRIVRPDGGIRWISSRGQVLRGEDGRVERVVGISLDITERRQTEEALKLADRRKDEFLATLAHELRNPLGAISNAVRLSRTTPLGAKDQAWIQEMLDRQMELLGRLVDDLLDVARITRGRIDLKLEVLRLSEVVNRAVEVVRPQIDRARHVLMVKYSPQQLWVEADRARLEQVMVNLLSNASKYTPEGGQIWLELAHDERDAIVTVRDTGIGIAAPMLPRVFDMFAQAEQGAARAQGGLGIGLTLVRRLIEMHGGQISVDSPGPGKGSTFTVRLPLAQPPAASEAAPQPAAPLPEPAAAPQSLRILVVDDNRDAAQTLSRLLRLSGHQTQVAFDGQAALQLAADQRPQLALLDIGLPVMDGYELARRLKKDHPGITLAAISGYGQAADLERSREAGFDEHFVKPVKLESLMRLIEARQAR